MTSRPTMLKYLRIAVTALSLTACVLLVALWVRSYGYGEYLYGNFAGHPHMLIGSNHGIILIGAQFPPWNFPPTKINSWGYLSQDASPANRRFGWRADARTIAIWFPTWVPALLAATLAAAPWIKWSKRFSLRTLLITTTLVAVVLGIVIAAR